MLNESNNSSIPSLLESSLKDHPECSNTHRPLKSFKELGFPKSSREEIESFDKQITPGEDSYNAEIRADFVSTIDIFLPVYECLMCSLHIINLLILQEAAIVAFNYAVDGPANALSTLPIKYSVSYRCHQILHPQTNW